jgi:hypothetical protein
LRTLVIAAASPSPKDRPGGSLRKPSLRFESTTIEALKNFGEEDMIPALKQAAKSDPAPEVNGHSIWKWVVEAIAAIEKRASR